MKIIFSKPIHLFILSVIFSISDKIGGCLVIPFPNNCPRNLVVERQEELPPQRSPPLFHSLCFRPDPILLWQIALAIFPYSFSVLGPWL